MYPPPSSSSSNFRQSSGGSRQSSSPPAQSPLVGFPTAYLQQGQSHQTLPPPSSSSSSHPPSLPYLPTPPSLSTSHIAGMLPSQPSSTPAPDHRLDRLGRNELLRRGGGLRSSSPEERDGVMMSGTLPSLSAIRQQQMQLELLERQRMLMSPMFAGGMPLMSPMYPQDPRMQMMLLNPSALREQRMLQPHMLPHAQHLPLTPGYVPTEESSPASNTVAPLKPKRRRGDYSDIVPGTLPKRRKRPKSKDSTSKYRGVSWHTRDQRWVARIWIKGKIRHLGSFRDEKRAGLAVDKKLLDVYGEDEDLPLNFPDPQDRVRVENGLEPLNPAISDDEDDEPSEQSKKTGNSDKIKREPSGSTDHLVVEPDQPKQSEDSKEETATTESSSSKREEAQANSTDDAGKEVAASSSAVASPPESAVKAESTIDKSIAQEETTQGISAVPENGKELVVPDSGSVGECKTEIKESDTTCKTEIKGSDATPETEIKDSDDTCKTEIKESDAASKSEIKETDGECKTESQGSDATSKIKENDTTLETEIKETAVSSDALSIESAKENPETKVSAPENPASKIPLVP